jgi:hypothetical protein
MSYANVASTIALVIALGGGTAWAAGHIHYKITSTSQIKPSVLKKLHGANGTNGTNGANGAAGPVGATGAAGAVQGLSATEGTPVTFTTGTVGSPTTVLTLNLPAGNFLVNAKNVVTAIDSVTPTSADYADATCQLVDGSTSDTGWLDTQFTDETSLFGSFFARATLPTEIAVSSAAPSTVTLGCDELAAHPVADVTLVASYAQIQAVQTTSNSNA